MKVSTALIASGLASVAAAGPIQRRAPGDFDPVITAFTDTLDTYFNVLNGASCPDDTVTALGYNEAGTGGIIRIVTPSLCALALTSDVLCKVGDIQNQADRVLQQIDDDEITFATLGNDETTGLCNDCQYSGFRDRYSQLAATLIGFMSGIETNPGETLSNGSLAEITGDITELAIALANGVAGIGNIIKDNGFRTVYLEEIYDLLTQLRNVVAPGANPRPNCNSCQAALTTIEALREMFERQG